MMVSLQPGTQSFLSGPSYVTLFVPNLNVLKEFYKTLSREVIKEAFHNTPAGNMNFSSEDRISTCTMYDNKSYLK